MGDEYHSHSSELGHAFSSYLWHTWSWDILQLIVAVSQVAGMTWLSSPKHEQTSKEQHHNFRTGIQQLEGKPCRQKWSTFWMQLVMQRGLGRSDQTCSATFPKWESEAGGLRKVAELASVLQFFCGLFKKCCMTNAPLKHSPLLCGKSRTRDDSELESSECHWILNVKTFWNDLNRFTSLIYSFLNMHNGDR